MSTHNDRLFVSYSLSILCFSVKLHLRRQRKVTLSFVSSRITDMPLSSDAFAPLAALRTFSDSTSLQSVGSERLLSPYLTLGAVSRPSCVVVLLLLSVRVVTSRICGSRSHITLFQPQPPD